MADDEVIEHLRAEWAALVELCTDLSEQDWQRATDCPGWTVQDNVAHLLGTELSLLGEPAPELAAAHPHVRNDLGRANEAWVEHFRGHTGDAVLKRFAETSERRLAALRAMSEQEMATPTESPVGELPYREFMGIRLMDSWVHEQDIRHSLERPGGFDAARVGVVIDRLLRPLGYVVAKRVQPPEGSVLAVRITDPVPRVHAVRFAEGKGRVVDAADEAVSTVSLTPSLLERLVAGRWSGDRGLEYGHVVIDGDVELGRTLVRNLATLP